MIWGRIPVLCHNRDIISAVCFTFLTTVEQWINGQSPCCYNLVCLLLFVTAMSQGEATHCSVGVWRRAGEYPGIFSDIFTKYPPAPARRSGGMVPAGRAEKIATVKFSWAGLVDWWPRNNDMRGILSSEPRPGYPQCSDQNTS